MAKIDDLKAAAQVHADAVAAFIARATEDFNHLKELVAQGANLDAQLAEMEATFKAGAAALNAMDLDPNFPTPVPPPVTP